MNRQDCKTMLAVLALTILVIEFIVFGGFGIAVPIVVAVYYAIYFWYSKKLNIKYEFKDNKLLIPILLSTLCFALFDNGILKFFNTFFLYGLIVLQAVNQFKMARYEPFTKEWPLEIWSKGIVMPLKNINGCPKVLKGEVGTRTKDIFKTLSKVVLGCIIATPLLFIMIGLLQSSDAAFEGVINFIINNIAFNVDEVIGRIIIFTILFFPMYGFFYGLRYETSNIVPSEDVKDKKTLDFTITMTITTLLCLVYMVYCFSQLAYFISAFQGILPVDFTFAEYARKGFFELVPLSIMNIAIMILLMLYTETKGSKKKIYWVKGTTLFIDLFTMFLVISAFSKMTLYISTYGLTLRRVYVAWFLTFILLILILFGIKLFLKRLKIMKYIFIAFIGMFLTLNYANVDYIVAKVNVDIYLKDENQDENQDEDRSMSELYDLSSSSVQEIVKLLEHQEGKEENIAGILEYHKQRLEQNAKWQQWNVATYRARKAYISQVRK